MLILGSKLIGASVLSLQTGVRLAITKSPVIDPSNLKIMAYEVTGPLLSEHPSFLLIADVRELSNIGMIIDSNDEFVGTDDVIALKKLIDLHFNIIGINVIDDQKHKLGKVTNYSIDTSSFIIQQICIKQPIIKSITATELLIHRSQIVEINNTSIVVRSAKNKIQQVVSNKKPTFINPFRSANPQTDNKQA